MNPTEAMNWDDVYSVQGISLNARAWLDVVASNSNKPYCCLGWGSFGFFAVDAARLLPEEVSCSS